MMCLVASLAGCFLPIPLEVWAQPCEPVFLAQAYHNSYLELVAKMKVS